MGAPLVPWQLGLSSRLPRHKVAYMVTRRSLARPATLESSKVAANVAATVRNRESRHRCARIGRCTFRWCPLSGMTREREGILITTCGPTFLANRVRRCSQGSIYCSTTGLSVRRAKLRRRRIIFYVRRQIHHFVKMPRLRKGGHAHCSQEDNVAFLRDQSTTVTDLKVLLASSSEVIGPTRLTSNATNLESSARSDLGAMRQSARGI
jgi:hypothetical protein